jgi:dTDP-4-dehydrorhamnose reductase
MRILVLGGDGMLGHQLIRSWQPRHEVWATLHQGAEAYRAFDLFRDDRSVFGTDVCRDAALEVALDRARPQAVVNAVGIVKQRKASEDPVTGIEVNALLPHRVARLCARLGVRLVHLSTDCVFSGTKGMYTEQDLPDAVDLYGRTKALGEVCAPHAVTLRTSMIGLELRRKTGLLEWYLAQSGKIGGYRRAVFSGLSTPELARFIERILLEAPGLSGVWHVSAAPISKYDLLSRLTSLLGRKDVRIEPDDSLVCDRSLDSSALKARFPFECPGWDPMLEELCESIRRRQHVA